MTTGALLFATNNGKIDYVAMARWSAANIRRHLNIPVAIVTSTNDADQATGFDHIIIKDGTGNNQRWFNDYNTTEIWHNDTRMYAYDLSPWDCTLILDVDYIVASDQLKLLLTADQDFLAHRKAYDITGTNNFFDHDTFGLHGMPMWWATVIMFRRSETARLIFDSMLMVRDNWLHYRNIHKILSRVYRNDYALSIALGMVNGHVLDHDSIQWPIASLLPEHDLIQLDTDQYRVDFVKDSKPRWISLHGQDFHAMGKQSLEAIIADPR